MILNLEQLESLLLGAQADIIKLHWHANNWRILISRLVRTVVRTEASGVLNRILVLVVVGPRIAVMHQAQLVSKLNLNLPLRYQFHLLSDTLICRLPPRWVVVDYRTEQQCSTFSADVDEEKNGAVKVLFCSFQVKLLTIYWADIRRDKESCYRCRLLYGRDYNLSHPLSPQPSDLHDHTLDNNFTTCRQSSKLYSRMVLYAKLMKFDWMILSSCQVL